MKLKHQFHNKKKQIIQQQKFKPQTLPAAQVTNGNIVGFDIALQTFLLHSPQKLKDNFPLPHELPQLSGPLFENNFLPHYPCSVT